MKEPGASRAHDWRFGAGLIASALLLVIVPWLLWPDRNPSLLALVAAVLFWIGIASLIRSLRRGR